MGLFGKNYAKINEKNKKEIISVLDQMMDTNPAYVNFINDMKVALLGQANTDGKEVAEIDGQILSSLVEAQRLLAAGSTRQAETYLQNAKQQVAKRTASFSGVKPKKGLKTELSPEQTMEIMLAKVQDKVVASANRYNLLKRQADAGDMVARSQLTIALQENQIAQQEFNALSNSQSREVIARMMQSFTEDQKQRIANRSISDEELSVLMNQYSQVSASIVAEGQDVMNLTNMVGGVSGAVNSFQNEMQVGLGGQTAGLAGMPQSLNVPGSSLGVGSMPQSLNVPGSSIGVGAMPQSLNVPGSSVGINNPFAQTGATNPFLPNNGDGINALSDNQLHGAKNMLESQIEKLREELEDKRADRRAIDTKMKNLLQKHAELPDAQARLLESEIDSAAMETENSDFELNNIEQEILQLRENLGIVTKLLSVKTREQRDQMLKQRFGGQFDVQKFAMLIAGSQEKFNADLQSADDANAVARANNTTVTRSTVDAGAGYSAKKKDYGDLEKMYGVKSEQ